MPEITLGDLLAWEPRLRPLTSAPVGAPVPPAAWTERELTWAVTVRATAPMLPAIRGGELVLLPRRVLTEAGVALPVLLREFTAHGIAGVVLDEQPAQPPGAGLPLLFAESMPPDFEHELNRLLTERRGQLYHTGTDLGRLLNNATSAGADLSRVLGTAAAFLEAPAAVLDSRGALLAATSPEAVPQSGRALAALTGLNRGWRDDRFVTHLATGQVLVLGPVPGSARALTRLVAERVALAAEAAIQRAADARPRGAARATALNALLLGPATEAQRLAAGLALPANAAYRVALVAPETDQATVQRTLAGTGTLHDAGQIDRATAYLIELRGDASGAGTRAGSLRRREPSTARELGASHATRGWLALSGPAQGTAALTRAAREARYVAALIGAGLVSGPTARFDNIADLGPYRLLYPLWGSPELAHFAAETLGHLPGRDRRGTLRGTLLAYLSAGGSHVDAAAALGIHRNTLAYRLKQIATLTGREPTSPDTRLLFHLALLASSIPEAPE